MPSFYKHDRLNDLFPPITQNKRRQVLPVARVTRNDIESRLKRSIENKQKIKQIYNEYRNERKQKQKPSLRSIPSLQLFPNDATIQLPSRTMHHLNETESLSLYNVPRISLYTTSSTATATTHEQPTVVTLHKEKYAQQRRAVVVDKESNHFAANDSNFISGVPEESHAPSTVTTTPSRQQPTTVPVVPSTHTIVPSPSSPSWLTSIPKQCVPILPTPMQQQGCDNLTQMVQTRGTSSIKISFENMIGLLNHPLVALMDDYEETADDKWSGSGKTQFIKQLVELLQKKKVPLKITIAAYDIDMESFLFDCIKNDLHLPCLRIGSILDDAWQREYGVIFHTQATREAGRQIRIPDTDLMIAFDIRLGPNDSVFTKIINKRGSEPVPIVWLFTLGSVENRVVSYFKNHSTSTENDHPWCHKFKWIHSNWWSDKQELVLNDNVWLPAEEATLISEQVIQSIISWAIGGFSGQYQFPMASTAAVSTAEVPIATEALPTSNIPHGTFTHSDEQATAPSSVFDQQSQDSDATILPPQDTQAITSSDTDIAGQSNSIQIPQSLALSTSTSDIDVDSNQHETIDLPESVKAQITQCFQYPLLQPVFERTSDISRHSSPSTSHRQRHRSSRWRGESNTIEEEEDDEVASFYSASEFVQDLKPTFMLIEPENNNNMNSDTNNNNLVTENSISLKLNPLKEAYEKEYQAVISRIQSQYDQEMKALQQKFEQQAFEKLQSGS